jgi:Tfp pilus assembly protein FimT
MKGLGKYAAHASGRRLESAGNGHRHHHADCSDWRISKMREKGVSLLELMVVVAIIMTVAAMIFINAVTALENIRLGQSATSYANLIQQVRIRAVQDDTFYTVQTAPAVGPAPASAFADLAGNGTNPIMYFFRSVNPMPFNSGPGLANLKSQFLPVTGQNTVNTTAAGPTFGPRGLPCTPSVGTCPYQTPTSYITFLQNSKTTKWEAITVTPAGRVRVWSYNGSAWSPMN